MNFDARLLLVALSLCLASACGAEEETTTPPAAEAPADEAPAEEEAAEEEAPAEEEAEAPAAEEAAEGEGTTCEQAFASVQALRAQLEEQMGGNNQAPPLDRDAYLATCNQLSPEAQRCSIMSYAMEHQEECAAVQDEINGAGE
ncbi:MAG: hypothetical protein RLO52_08770 [Sandaracinaceae bacterium]